MKVAIVGATGLVGNVMKQILEERNFPVRELIPVASEKSVGTSYLFKGKEYKVVSMQEALGSCPDIALFSAGGSTSLEFAPRFAAVGTVVIDNSSAWRMHPNIPLIVPEINADLLTKNDKIIANPNCSTIQMVMVLSPIHKEYGIKRVVVSTYQSVTGTGKAAVDQLNGEITGKEVPKVYPHQIFKNALPHCDTFVEENYTKEEWKLIHETQKILRDNTIAVTATAIRVPVQGGHSESVNVALRNPFQVEDIMQLLQQTEGVVLQDDVQNNIYPMPFYSEGKDEVFVGRIRRDLSQENSLNMWIVADNLRKGAATNAVQIAEYLVKNNLLKSSIAL